MQYTHREELIKKFLDRWTGAFATEIADLIIADRKEILKPLIENKAYMEKFSQNDTVEWKLKILISDRDETLALAGIEKENENGSL